MNEYTIPRAPQQPMEVERLHTISKDFAFSASHRLTSLPDDHQCARLHGHNYIVRVSLTGFVRPPGFVVDYGELAWFGRWLDKTYDHRDLNQVLGCSDPTAEYLSESLLRALVAWVKGEGYHNVSTVAVAVSETPKTWAQTQWDRAAEHGKMGHTCANAPACSECGFVMAEQEDVL